MTLDPTPGEWRRLSAELDVVLELPEPQRAAHIEAAFAGESALRDAARALLAAHMRAGSFLEAPVALGAPELFDAPEGEPERPTTQVGPWRVERELGHGGMGVVYLAERADGQFRQRVALKLARAGLPSPEALARFRRERQILARLQHPHIARLLEGGVAADGRPYFAMEYVEGRPLLAWCDARRVAIEPRLRLFVKVCGAVHYAHRNLVVHRDLKPANVLVGEDGEPRLLDFGIAKLLADEADEEASALTRAGQLAMTPEYAAPEQKRGEPITTATDVYALGVLLFELLTGRRPPASDAADSEAPRASSVVAHDGGGPDGPARAAARGVTPRRLARRLRGDLDTIAQTALRPEPERRYASAEALAADVERHLAGLPVLARPDTLGYRLRSFARRHRVGLAAAALVTLALAAGVATTAWQARARLREARKARAVSEFLVSLFGEADPDSTLGRRVTAEEMLERGARRIEVELRGQPDVQAELLTAVGRIYVDLGLYERAAGVLGPVVERRRSAGADRADLAASLWALGRAQMGYGEWDAAEASLREALRAARGARESKRAELAGIEVSMAGLLRERGRYDEAEQLLRAALPVLRRASAEGDSAGVADGLAKLADLRHSRGDYQGAAALLREALAVMRRGPRAERWATASTLNRLGAVLRDGGRLDEAAAAHAEALATQRRVLGETHPALGTTLHDLAVVTELRGERAAAAALHEQAVEIYRRRLGPEHPWLATALHDLAATRLALGQPEQAEPLLREALGIYTRALGPRHEFVAMTLASLARVRRLQGDAVSAERLLRESLAVYRRALPRGHAVTGTVLLRLGELLAARGREGEAEPLLREALESWLAAFGDDDRRTVEARMQLGACLTALGCLREAETLLLAARDSLERATGSGAARAAVAARLVSLYERWGRPADAARYRRAAARPRAAAPR